MSTPSFCSLCGKLLKPAPPISEIFPWVSKDDDMDGLYGCEDHVSSGVITPKDFKTGNPFSELGKYLYMYPNWEHPVIVKIVEEKDKLYVDFDDNELDLLLEDCDSCVLWYKVKE